MSDETSADRDATLVDVFARWAQAAPEATAVVDSTERVSYRQLTLAAERVRRQLVEAGVQPGAVIGIAMERTWRLVAAMVGALAAGVVYVPLDPQYPLDRLQFMCRDASVRFICADSLLPWADEGASMVVTGEPAEEALDTTAAATGGYIIYTSGSTGRPKGVVIPQANVPPLFEAADQVFELTDADVWLMFHSFSFDFTVWEIWGALWHGGTVVILDDGQRRDPKRVIAVLENENVTVVQLVPSAFKYLMRAYERAPLPLRSLRYFLIGGEALDRGAVRRWLALRDGPERLFNVYGPTETTVLATYAEITPEDLADDAQPTRIGKPFPHHRTEVFAEDGTPAAPGRPGELCITGPSLSTGYLGRPDLTAERFPELALETGTERWYRTGDLVQCSEDGDIFYLGRIGGQVKLRGFRIETGEIESVLRDTAGVADAAVTTVAMPSGEPMLVAMIVPDGPARLEPEDLRHACGARLPAHMTPGRFLEVSAIPTTASGKVDRASLGAAAMEVLGRRSAAARTHR